MYISGDLATGHVEAQHWLQDSTVVRLRPAYGCAVCPHTLQKEI